MVKITGYDLSRNWFDFCFENPEKIKPNHTAMYFFAIEHCNRLGWKQKFGFPSQMVMDALGIKNWRTYKNTLNDLIEFGFIEMIELSKNQYSSNIISIKNAYVKNTKALDKALSKHIQKQGQSIVSIDKPINNTTKEQRTNNVSDEIKNFTASLSKLFPENITTKLTDSQKRNWIDTIDKLIRIDKFTKQQIEKAIKAGRKDEFWSKQFLSMNKLRKLNKDDIKYINVFLNLNGHQQTTPQLKEIIIKHGMDG